MAIRSHVLPVSEGGGHREDHGLLLRSDVHRLFDRGYATVTPDYRFRVNRRLQDDFDNCEPCYPFDGRQIWLPPEAERPGREFWSGTGTWCFGADPVGIAPVPANLRQCTSSSSATCPMYRSSPKDPASRGWRRFKKRTAEAVGGS